MSSVTMAADSTQADFIHHRVRPAGKAALVRSGFGRGRQEGHRRVRSRSRHRSSSSRSHKPKRHSKEHQVAVVLMIRVWNWARVVSFITSLIIAIVIIISSTHSFIHSFFQNISIATLQVHYYSDSLLTTALILCQS